MARATSAASAMASTTVAGPRRQSPAAQTPSTPVEVAARRPRRSCSTPAASYRLGVDALAHGADHRGGGKLDGLARGDGAATAACIRLAKLHNIAGQHGAVERLGRQQLAELNAVGKSKIELFLVSGHLLLGAAIHQAHVLHASQTLGHAGRVHGGVTRRQ